MRLTDLVCLFWRDRGDEDCKRSRDHSRMCDTMNRVVWAYGTDQATDVLSSSDAVQETGPRINIVAAEFLVIVAREVIRQDHVRGEVEAEASQKRKHDE